MHNVFTCKLHHSHINYDFQNKSKLGKHSKWTRFFFRQFTKITSEISKTKLVSRVNIFAGFEFFYTKNFFFPFKNQFKIVSDMFFKTIFFCFVVFFNSNRKYTKI
jgi:hypothetical protein